MAIYVEFSKPIGDFFEATSFSLNWTAPAQAGAPLRRAQRNGMIFTKKNDHLSAKIWTHAAEGTNFVQVIIELYQKDAYRPYLKYTAANVIIAHVSSSVSSEQIDLDFEKISVEIAG
jgi:type VI protein secretion system component Hcp